METENMAVLLLIIICIIGIGISVYGLVYLHNNPCYGISNCVVVTRHYNATTITEWSP